ncbi:hypothetical protein [Cyanobium sp. NIES-981]|uniref:hypothetical protein n=1 Tax=Cyanobium sp. NIES-981 TaxID=1851505 RepID=UPI0007DDC7BF|nr:hypothetical protein [Cyanobium sp. NIES-981]SBO41846.1 conserved exported protein of unknown function [Cyanobium sp. NIES-981]
MLKRAAALLILATGVMPAGVPAQANMMDFMIRKYCLAAVDQEVKASGKPAPAGMADYTCDCVVQEMKNRKTQEQAKATCKARTAKKYNL